jgi:hypothetical protein
LRLLHLSIDRLGHHHLRLLNLSTYRLGHHHLRLLQLSNFRLCHHLLRWLHLPTNRLSHHHLRLLSLPGLIYHYLLLHLHLILLAHLHHRLLHLHLCLLTHHHLLLTHHHLLLPHNSRLLHHVTLGHHCWHALLSCKLHRLLLDLRLNLHSSLGDKHSLIRVCYPCPSWVHILTHNYWQPNHCSFTNSIPCIMPVHNLQLICNIYKITLETWW